MFAYHYILYKSFSYHTVNFGVQSTQTAMQIGESQRVAHAKCLTESVRMIFLDIRGLHARPGGLRLGAAAVLAKLGDQEPPPVP